ncbi:replication enhancer protein [Whitefly-associated begomovirus 7]|uniref:Replication enhancer n=1 Tax=Whitefly-associated begomovirus 7 TaxID=2169744 RepID=A0A0P0I042_9GEMI|nr:replication enhancer protein [Whitefly-associated begomovirus 7]ALK03550.1 replication enhancer protein [Whitefly-associated begomovirus 7]ALK03556.1 replication enhancer protein [Whitefly-associated begomovirus 7]ALK03562.1 replication enhancer protein [Whitefly-associated begomovirus 7]ALK03586.1 replication enhancer protein [Whitefly-associated begomovirus 7]ALK03598.1 replication enhancer protein [Whitefly-associated begomovirus 7]
MDSRTGEPITADQARSGVFTWEITNPLYFKTLRHDQRPFNSNNDIITVQIRFNHNLRRDLGIHKCFLTFQIWTALQPPTGLFLKVFRYQVLKYLDSLGVISINNVIRAVDHVLYDVIAKTVQVVEKHEIKFNLY